MPSRLRSLVGWSARVFGEDIANRVFSPLVADWQHEADAHVAMRARAVLHARWLAALARTGLVVSARELVCCRVPRSEVRQVLRTLARGAIGGAGLLFAALLLMVLDRRPRALTPWFALAMFANATTIAGPLSLGPGAARLAATGGDRRARRWLLAGLTAGVLTLQTVAVGWLEPAVRDISSRAHPQLIDGAPPGTAIGARSTPRLLLEARRGTGRWLGSAVTRRELASRLALSVYPFAVAVFAWRLGSWSTRWPAVLAVTAWLLPAGLLLAPSWLVFSYRVGGDYGTPAALLQFLPTALLLVLSACLRRAGAASPSKATNRSNPKEAR